MPATTTTRAPRRRPPHLALHSRPAVPNTLIQTDSPVLAVDSDLQLSSPDSPSSVSSPLKLHPASPNSDEISKDLAELDQLRQSVKQNLRLRPIRSSGNIHSPWRDLASPGLSSALSSASTVYYTPTETPLTVFRPASPSPHGLDPDTLHDCLASSNSHPLLINTRPQAAYLASHIAHSINVAIPSLILKRIRKSAAPGFQMLDALVR